MIKRDGALLSACNVLKPTRVLSCKVLRDMSVDKIARHRRAEVSTMSTLPASHAAPQIFVVRVWVLPCLG